MEKFEIKQEFCIFCFKNVEELAISKEQNDLQQFFKMLERHLISDLRRDEDESEENSSRNGYLLRGRCCEDCYRIVNSFCDLYCQIKNLELKINWKISNLTNIMSSADKETLRVERFRNSFIKEERGVGGGTCLENVWKSRKHLINSCERKLRHSYPTFNIAKCDKNQPIFSPSSPSDFTPDTVSNSRDGGANISGNATVLPIPLEQGGIANAEYSLENLKVEIETPPIQSTSSVVDNLTNTPTTTCVRQRRKKETPKKKKKLDQQSELKRVRTRSRSRLEKSKLVKTRFAGEIKNSCSHELNMTVISEPIIVLQDGDTNDNENCSLKNLSHPISSKVKEELSETSFTEGEADGVDLSSEEFDIKFDNFTNSNLLADELDGHGFAPCETSPEQIIKSTPAMLAVVDDTKHESTTSSPASPISDDMPYHTNEESVSSESPCATSNSSTSNPSVSNRRSSRMKKTTYIRKRKRLSSAVVIPPKKVTTDGSSYYECDCGEKCTSIGGYRLHRRQIHGMAILSEKRNKNSEPWVLPKSILDLLVPKYSCSEANCSELFVMEEELENHKRQHGTFQCEGCPTIKNFAQDLSIHEAKHSAKNPAEKVTATGRKLWHCFRCKFFCTLKNVYIRHHAKKHLKIPPSLIMCPICRKSFNCTDEGRQHSLKGHFKKYHDVSDMDPESVPKCSQCSAYFRTEDFLQTHINLVCKNKCSDCGKTFPNRKYFLKHRLKHHVKITTPLLHKCKVEQCGKAFEAKIDLEMHSKFQHSPGWNSPVQCDTCGKEVFQRNLKKHIYHAHRKVKREKSPKVCEQCGMSFKDNHDLQQHYLSHADPQTWKFSCSICGRKCRDKYTLAYHEKTHSKEKPFVCQVCGVSYAHIHNFRRHVNNKHPDAVKDIPRPRRINKVNVKSRKGIKCRAVFDKKKRDPSNEEDGS